MSTVPLYTPGTPVIPGVPAASGTASGAPTRPGIVSLAVKDEAGLHAVYMSFLKNDGIFVPAQCPYQIGEKVFLVLSLLGRPQRHQVADRVAWTTPVGMPAKTPGTGVHLGEGEQCRVLRRVIEEALGKQISSQRPTQIL